MLNYTKKCSDPPLQPILHHKKVLPASASKEHRTDRIKSLSYNSNFSSNTQTSHLTNITFQSDPSFEAEMEQLRETFKNL